MRHWELNKRDSLYLAILLALSLVKLYRIDGGLVLGEPDEVIYNDLAHSLAAGQGLSFSEGPYYYNLPLFPLLGSLLLKLVPSGFLALRLLSWLFSLMTTLTIYFYSRWKLRDTGGFRETAFTAGLVFLLCPLAVFYSRLGLLEAGVTAFSFLFVALLDSALERKSLKLSVLSGLVLALALGTKYSALMFVLAAMLLLMVRSVRLTLESRANRWGMKYLNLDIYTLLPLMLSTLIIFPFWIHFYRVDYYNFKVQSLVNIVGWSKMTAAKVWVGENVFTLGKLAWWVSWPLVVASLVGLFGLVRRREQFEVVLVTLGTVLLFIITRKPFYPRYFFPALPLGSVTAAVGILALLTAIRGVAERASVSATVIRIVVAVVALTVFGVVGLRSLEAIDASCKTLLEQTAGYLGAEDRSENPYIFSNWWPNIVGRTVGTENYSWVVESGEEIEAFLEGEKRSTMEILETESGWVVLERGYSRRLISPAEDRAVVARFIQENFEPVKIIVDRGPNFPYFEGGNRIAIYQF